MKSFFKKLSSFFLEGGLKETVLRFPLPAICALLSFVLAVLSIHDVIDDDKIVGRIAACLCTGFFWFGGLRLVVESRNWSKTKELLWALIFFVPFSILMALADQFEQYLIFIIPALLLFLMVAPFTKSLRDGADDFSFWQFNHTLWIGVVVSALAVGLMMAGLQAAVASIKALFDVNISHHVMEDIWAFSALLVGPVYALSWVPKTFEFKEADYKEPTGLSFMLNWILAPLILIYFLIIYAYFGKIILTQSLPSGTLSYMVMGFVGVSIATYLAGWPMKDKSGALLQKIYKYLFVALSIPVVLQFWAIGLRINDYGVTEQRYMVALSAVWMAVIIGLFVFKKIRSIKIIPALLTGLFFLAAFGPWGAVGLSGISQLGRLETLLTQYEILKGGEIFKTEKEISFDDRKSISSKLQYLKNTSRFDDVIAFLSEEQKKQATEIKRKERARFVPAKTKLKPVLPPDVPMLDEAVLDTPIEIYPQDITKLMGFNYVGEYMTHPNAERFDLYAHGMNRGLLNVKGYDFISSDLYARFYDPKNDEGFHRLPESMDGNEKEGAPEVSWRLDKDNMLVIGIADKGDITFDLTDLVIRERANQSQSQNQNQEEPRFMVLEGVIAKTSSKVKVRLVFNNISGKLEDGLAQVENVSFAMLIKL